MHKSVTGTTSSSGNISLDLSADYVVKTVRCTSTNAICCPYWAEANGTYYCNVSKTFQSVSSTEVTLEVYYEVA